MDDWRYAFNYIIEKAMVIMAYFMMMTIVEKTVEADRKKVKEALGHEPTQENMKYYYELQQEEKLTRTSRQQEVDRSKLRSLVFGDEGNHLKAK